MERIERITNADAFFVIGKTHEICQDYATAGPFKTVLAPDGVSHVQQLTGSPHVIVSDGCSRAPKTDYGSRLMVRAAEEFINADVPHADFARSVITTAFHYGRSMRLPVDSLDATLLTAAVKNGSIQVMVSGDGVVAARERTTGRIHVKSYEYPSGAPFYLRYTLDGRDTKAYMEKFGFKAIVSTYIIEPNGKYELKDETPTEDQEDYLFVAGYGIQEFDLVVLFSDGVRSFTEPVQSETSKQRKQVHFMQPLVELLAYKNYAGQFVQRRVRRAFDPALGLFPKKNWVNSDDLSVGAIIT